MTEEVSKPYVKLSVNISDETAAQLRKMMGEQLESATNIVAKAIMLTHVLYEEQEKGNIIYLANKRGKLLEELELL